MYRKNRDANKDTHAYTFEVDNDIVNYLILKCNTYKIKYDVLITNIIEVVFDRDNIDFFVLLALKRIAHFTNPDILNSITKFDNEFLLRIKDSNLSIADKKHIFSLYKTINSLEKYVKTDNEE